MMRKGKAPLPLVADKDGKTLGILMLTDFGIAEDYRRPGELNRIDGLKKPGKVRLYTLITTLALSRYRFFS